MSEQLKRDLYDYEVTPPPGTWLEITRRLRESDTSSLLAKKMSDYEVSPPAGLFQEIMESLAQKHGTSLPGKVIRKPLPQLVAAASLFGIVLMSSLYLFYNNTSKKLLADSQKNTEKKSNRQIESVGRAHKGGAEPLATESGHSASVGAIASVYNNHREKKNYSRGTSRGIYRTMVKIAQTMSASKPITIAAKPIRNPNGDIIQDPKVLTSPGQKYISITGPNGQQTKISSKFNNLLLYLNNESDIEDFDGYFDRTFLESLIWKSRFNDWREKIMKTSFTPTSSNFMDILEFKDLISKDVQN
jgi:hypothetical protein